MAEDMKRFSRRQETALDVSREEATKKTLPRGPSALSTKKSARESRVNPCHMKVERKSQVKMRREAPGVCRGLNQDCSGWREDREKRCRRRRQASHRESTGFQRIEGPG